MGTIPCLFQVKPDSSKLKVEKMKRREFIKKGAATAALPFAGSVLLTKSDNGAKKKESYVKQIGVLNNQFRERAKKGQRSWPSTPAPQVRSLLRGSEATRAPVSFSVKATQN